MEAVRLTPVQSPLFRQNRLESTSRNLIGTRRTRKLQPFKPFIAASLSEPTTATTAGVSQMRPAPSSVAARENGASLSSSAPPPRLRVSPDSLRYPSGYLGAVPDRSVVDGNDDVMNAMGYLTNILSSKTYDVAIETPLQWAPRLSQRLGVGVWLKREDLQPVSSLYVHTSLYKCQLLSILNSD